MSNLQEQLIALGGVFQAAVLVDRRHQRREGRKPEGDLQQPQGLRISLQGVGYGGPVCALGDAAPGAPAQPGPTESAPSSAAPLSAPAR